MNKADVYLTNRRGLYIFVPHGKAPPGAFARPGAKPVKPWKTVDLDDTKPLYGLTVAEKKKLAADIVANGFGAPGFELKAGAPKSSA